MTRFRWLLLGGLVLSALIVAFFLQDVVYHVLVVPLAYVWWTIKFYYSLIPQLWLWIVLLALLFMSITASFVLEVPSYRRRAQPRKPRPGQVEALAGWMIKARQGNYFKWQVANRLGRIERGLSEMSGQRVWLKSGNEAVQKYLDAGLYQSFVDFPRPRNRFRRPAPTPLDLDPNQAVAYLESQLENDRGRHS